MSRPPETVDEDEPSWEAFERELWRAVKRGSVTAMKLWADLHREELKPSKDDPFEESRGEVRPRASDAARALAPARRFRGRHLHSLRAADLGGRAVGSWT